MSFAIPALLGAYERELGLDGVLLLSDEQRGLYEALGFERASVARVWLDPRVWRRYAQLLARGRRARAPRQDTLQLGGDAVLEAGGALAWLYRSRGPEDRPSVDQVVGAAARAA